MPSNGKPARASCVSLTGQGRLPLAAIWRDNKLNKKEICVICNGPIDASSLSFEQLLVNDKDFCRTCWDEILYSEEEPSLPSLIVEAP